MWLQHYSESLRKMAIPEKRQVTSVPLSHSRLTIHSLLWDDHESDCDFVRGKYMYSIAAEQSVSCDACMDKCPWQGFRSHSTTIPKNPSLIQARSDIHFCLMLGLIPQRGSPGIQAVHARNNQEIVDSFLWREAGTLPALSTWLQGQSSPWGNWSKTRSWLAPLAHPVLHGQRCTGNEYLQGLHYFGRFLNTMSVLITILLYLQLSFWDPGM